MVETIFQAPTCRSLGLELELRLRSTARRLGSGEFQQAESALRVELRAYRRGELLYHAPEFGSIAAGGTLILCDKDVSQVANLSLPAEEELLFVARLVRPGMDGYFAQEHQLSYSSPQSSAQAYLLYDQQPLRLDGSRPAPVVLMMPKIWVGGDVNTYVMACNASQRTDVMQQAEPVQFTVLDEAGRKVCDWDQRFYFNEARAFDLRRRIAPHVDLSQGPRFFNLIGRGGSGSFVFFAVMRNTRTQHFAIEHSLPPMYYMDGDMRRVRAEACDAKLVASNLRP